MKLYTGDVVRVINMPNYYINIGITRVAQALCPELADIQHQSLNKTEWCNHTATVIADGMAETRRGVTHCFVLRLDICDGHMRYMFSSESIIGNMDEYFDIVSVANDFSDEFLALLENED